MKKIVLLMLMFVSLPVLAGPNEDLKRAAKAGNADKVIRALEAGATNVDAVLNDVVFATEFKNSKVSYDIIKALAYHSSNGLSGDSVTGFYTTMIRKTCINFDTPTENQKQLLKDIRGFGPWDWNMSERDLRKILLDVERADDNPDVAPCVFGFIAEHKLAGIDVLDLAADISVTYDAPNMQNTVTQLRAEIEKQQSKNQNNK